MSLLLPSPGSFVDPACPIAWDHPLNRGLIHSFSGLPNSGWRGGKTLRDIVRGGKTHADATLINTPTWKRSVCNGGFPAVSYNGTSQAGQVALNLSAYSALSVSMFIWVVSYPSAGSIIFEFTADGQANNGGFHMYDEAGVGTNIALRGSGGVNLGRTASHISTGTWHHLLAIFDMTLTANEVSFYVDGIYWPVSWLLNANNAGSTFANSTLYLVSRTSSSAWTQAILSDVRLYGRALGAKEATWLNLEGRRGYPETLRWVGSKVYSIPAAGGGSPVTVTPSTLALTLTTYAPAVSTPRVVTPTTAALTFTTYAPTVSTPQTVTPTTATLTLTTFAPTISTPQVVTPTTLALVTTGYAPTISTPVTVTPTTLSLTTTGYAPSIVLGTVVTPSTASLTLTGYAPTVSTPRLVTPDTLALTTTAYAPSVVIGTVATPSTVTLTLTGYAPTVSTPRVVTPVTLAITTTGYAPTIVVGITVTPTTLILTTTGYAPSVLTPVTVTPTTLAMTTTGYAPTIEAGLFCKPGTATLTLTTYAPTVSTPCLVTPSTLALVITGFAPTVSTSTPSPVEVVPGTAVLVITGFAPSVSTTSSVRSGGGGGGGMILQPPIIEVDFGQEPEIAKAESERLRLELEKLILENKIRRQRDEDELIYLGVI